MLFKRKRALKRHQQVLNLLWPRRGWWRAGQYLGHRLARLPASPHSIAAGFASGAAISFTPFVGLHLVGAWFLSLPMRGNWIAAWLGTLVGNPWTFPLIWLLIYRSGIAVTGQAAADEGLVSGLSFGAVMTDPSRVLPDIIWPMTVGGLPFAVTAFALTYWSSRFLVQRYQDRRRARLLVPGKLKRHLDAPAS